MRDFMYELSDAEMQVLSEISVNPVFKKIVERAIADTASAMAELDPDDEYFNSRYRSHQWMLNFFEDVQSTLNELFGKYYKPLQGQGE